MRNAAAARRWLRPGLLLALGAIGIPARPQERTEPGPILIEHATLIDVAGGGRTANDVDDVSILLGRGRVLRIGKAIRPPAHATRIDARGAFVIPGLIDAMGALRGQRFADAYLFEGVTSVVVPTGAGNETIAPASPSPHAMAMAEINGVAANGGAPLTSGALATAVDRAARSGARILLIGLDIAPAQLAAVRRAAAAHRLAMVGEMAATTYANAIAGGVRVFARNDRYLTALAPAAVFAHYGRSPNTPAGARPAFRAVCASDPDGEPIRRFAAQLIAAGATAMPALAIEATADDVGADNPWRSRAAAFFDPTDLDNPVDPATGARPYLEQHADRRADLQACARTRRMLDTALHQAGVRYVAASGAPSYGVLPGGGLHVELALLQSIGLAPHEVLAAATSNLADAMRWRDLGSVAPGKRADLLILGSDPRRSLAALEDIRTVILGGTVVDRAALLARAAHPERAKR